MRAFIAALAACAVQAGAASKFETLAMKNTPDNSNFTPLTVVVDGVEQTKYIAAERCTSSGADYICPMNGRGHILNTPNWDASNPDFWTPKLLGYSVEWDMDVSSFECGCFNTFYTVTMPAKKDDGSLWPTDMWYYCDANAGNWGGGFCPELDLMEANKWALQTTPHKCDAPSSSGHYSSCDGSGSAKNTIDALGESAFGPGGKIDTGRPFHIKVDLNEKDGKFTQVVTTLTQDGNSVQMINNDKNYTSQMSDDLARGMVFVVSAWEGDDSWLRKSRCSGGCYGDPTEKISNLTLTKSDGPAPVVPPYDPADFDYGNSCGGPSVELCADASCPSADHCKWSWPKGGNPGDPNAHCRCDIIDI